MEVGGDVEKWPTRTLVGMFRAMLGSSASVCCRISSKETETVVAPYIEHSQQIVVTTPSSLTELRRSFTAGISEFKRNHGRRRRRRKKKH